MGCGIESSDLARSGFDRRDLTWFLLNGFVGFIVFVDYAGFTLSKKKKMPM